MKEKETLKIDRSSEAIKKEREKTNKGIEKET